VKNEIIQFTPTEVQKNDIVSHILYEIEQILEIGFLTNGIYNESQKISSVVHNSLTEAQLLHCRCLIDFFQNGNRLKRNNAELDDVLCTDFGFSAKKLDIPASFINHLNKNLAHLSYSRIKRDEIVNELNESKVHQVIIDRSLEFVKHLLANLNLSDFDKCKCVKLQQTLENAKFITLIPVIVENDSIDEIKDMCKKAGDPPLSPPYE